jgi:murein DD-endopeptidase MepM/ murein hydrolase activator NlpD
VKVRPGDTLSEIVHRALKKRGVSFSTSELYDWVERVAQANSLANPDLIHAGQRIDLSILDGHLPREENSAKTQSTSAPPIFGIPLVGQLTSGFGMRMHPIDHVPHFHRGIDIAAPKGTQVCCVSDGVVAFAGRRGTYGNCVDIDHGGGSLTRYAHLDSISVQAGQEIRAGHDIGTVGDSGRTTGPHLHFELHRGGRRIDPLPFIPLGTRPAVQIAAGDDRGKKGRPA